MNNTVIKKWNLFDAIIYKAETYMKQIRGKIKDSKKDIPDPEEMITAATAHLQKENKQLKKKLYPGEIVVESDCYYCPDCHEQLSQELIKKKFCPECGKRIVLQKNLYVKTRSDRRN